MARLPDSDTCRGPHRAATGQRVAARASGTATQRPRGGPRPLVLTGGCAAACLPRLTPCPLRKDSQSMEQTEPAKGAISAGNGA